MCRTSLSIAFLLFAPLFVSIAHAAAPGETSEQFSGPFSPNEALDKFELPKGFRIEVVAAEPDVLDPVAISFDEDGRLYVAEMRDYPSGPPAPAGRIRLLEDTDGDGRMDRSTVFVDGLKYPADVMAYDGGVLVCAAPDILFFQDTDGDRVSDVRKVLYTGFREINPQHRANGLCYGIDNWIYGANAYGDIQTNAKQPPKIVKGARSDFRIRPDSGDFELISGRSQFAMALDDWNNRFVNENARHIRHPVLQSHYLQRNPELAVPGLLEEISDHGALAKVFPLSKIQNRFNEFHHAGYTTTACGLAITRGGAFPKEYQGNCFCCEPLHNLVHRDVLKQDGVTFVASRGDTEQDRDFLASSDNWFRPVNLTEGPDGALYVVDFYRPVIEHPFGIPVELQKDLDFRAGDDRGRIYRILHEDSPPAKKAQLSSATTEELVAHLEDDNAWWRMNAQVLLLRKQDKSAVAPLTKLAATSASATGRLHALWTLEGLSALDTKLVEAALNDEQPQVREHALKLAESRLSDSTSLAAAVLKRADDREPRVRFQLAFTLGEFSSVSPWRNHALELLAKILVRDGADHRFRTAVLSSTSGREEKLLALLRSEYRQYLENAADGSIEFVRMLADTVGTRRDEDQLVRLLQVVTTDAKSEPAQWQMAALAPVVDRLHGTRLSLESLTKKARATEVLSGWGARMLDVATDNAQEPSARVEAIGLLALAQGSGDTSSLVQLLRPQEPQSVQRAAVRALAAVPGKAAAELLLEGWSGHTAAVRDEILTALLARADRALQLIDAIDAGRVRAGELGNARLTQLTRIPSPEVWKRAGKILEQRTPAERLAKIKQVTSEIDALKGSVDEGRKVFLAKCANCHNRRTDTEGILHLSPGKHDVGPGLGHLRTRPKSAFLQDILDPNREVAPRFLNYTVVTEQGRIVTGMILSETPNSLTFQNGKEVASVNRSEIDEMKNSGLSLMPEGFESGLSVQNLADLLEFLTHE